ncbi:signal peptidase I [Terrimonas sp.]|uniref:signal peptidase I n=1 Tax=Terrimonas sp. TaxID=1914338 RepID=UPI000D51640B|nr:signal peptidase I [Terrimonas sp.]PVD51132.1 signal peptidase I [Terrimonas sp.]
MNSGKKILIGFCIIILLLWIAGRLTNAIQFFALSASSNEPTLKRGSYIFSSNLAKPKLLDFICFHYNTQELGNQIWIFRLCGTEGDNIEIKNGVLFLNGKNVDAGLTLNHTFIMSNKDFNVLQDKFNPDPEQYYQIAADSFYFFTNEKFLKELNITGRKLIDKKGTENADVENIWQKKWNKDNFGPVTVPPGKYFVLGDNRDNAQDSRYIGFINKDDFAGTVLGKK